MNICGIHICMDEIRMVWPVVAIILPTLALVRGCFRTKCKEKNHVH